MITVRWGGDLTPLGKEQALDAQFRHNMYPDTEGVRLYVCMYVCMLCVLCVWMCLGWSAAASFYVQTRLEDQSIRLGQGDEDG